MAVDVTPGVVNTISTDSAVQRNVHRGILGGAVTAFAGGIGALNAAAHGVCTPGALKVVQNGTPNMSVNVAAGEAFITGTASAVQGPYGFHNAATVNLAIAAADATNARKDLVIAQARHTAIDGTGFTDNRLAVVTGTPSGSPVDPSLSAFPNALVLARVDVPANDTAITDAQITDLRTFGGRLPLTAAIACHVTGSLVAADATTGSPATWTAATNPHGFTVGATVIPNIPGYYLALARSEMASATATMARRITRVALNGGSVNDGADEATAAALTTHGQTAFAVVKCNGTTDTVNVVLLQDNTAGSALTIEAELLVMLLFPTL